MTSMLTRAAIAGLGVCASLLAAPGPLQAQPTAELPSPALHAPGDFAAPTLKTPGPAKQAAGGTGEKKAEAAGQDKTERSSLQNSDAAGEQMIPGVGTAMLEKLPDDSTQVLVATGPSADSDTSTLVLYERIDGKWTELRRFASHNGKNGWLEDRREGDGTSPVGVFALTDAGGYLADPGTSLNYSQDREYRGSATRVYGEEYTNVFDYVIAINYNRVAGTPPSDSERPLGWDKGGGIWLHVDHNKGTRGCVTVTREEMKYLLKTLDAKKKPHIIMGDEKSVSADA